MFRSILVLSLALVFAVSLWLQGNAGTRRIIVALLATFAPLIAASLWAQRHPHHYVARLMFQSRGPRTGGQDLTKAELRGSALSFLGLGAVALVLSAAILYGLTVVRSGAAQTTLLVLVPFTLFPAAMGILGGLYLLVRARP